MFQNVRNHCHDSQTNTTTDTVLVFFSEGISAVTSTITSQFCSSADLNLLHSVLNTWLFSNEYRALSLEVHFAKAYSTEGISGEKTEDTVRRKQEVYHTLKKKFTKMFYILFLPQLFLKLCCEFFIIFEAHSNVFCFIYPDLQITDWK